MHVGRVCNTGKGRSIRREAVAHTHASCFVISTISQYSRSNTHPHVRAYMLDRDAHKHPWRFLSRRSDLRQSNGRERGGRRGDYNRVKVSVGTKMKTQTHRTRSHITAHMPGSVAWNSRCSCALSLEWPHTSLSTYFLSFCSTLPFHDRMSIGLIFVPFCTRSCITYCSRRSATEFAKRMERHNELSIGSIKLGSGGGVRMVCGKAGDSAGTRGCCG